MRRTIVLKHLKRTFKLCQVVALIAIVGAVRAQGETIYGSFAPITPENVTQIVQVERLGNGAPRMLSFAPDGSRLAVATTLGVWVISPQWGQAGPNHAILLEGQGGASSVTFSPGGVQVVAGGDDGSVMFWDAATGTAVDRLDNHIYPVSAVAWSGHLVASGDQSGIIRLWDTETWSEDQLYDVANSGAVRALAFDAAGHSLNVETETEPIVLHLDTGEIQIWRGVLAPYLHPPFTVQGKNRHGSTAQRCSSLRRDAKCTRRPDFMARSARYFFSPKGKWRLEQANPRGHGSGRKP